MKRFLLPALLLAALAAPATAGAETGPDYITSDNVTLTDRIKTVGDGVGARIVGPYMYVTTTKSLSIFDIKTDPAHPKEIGLSTMDVEFENEEVPTNGKILGISGQDGCSDPLSSNITSGTVPKQGDDSSTWSASEATGCLTLWDVTDPANVKKVRVVAGAGEHTTACAFDCQHIGGAGHLRASSLPSFGVSL